MSFRPLTHDHAHFLFEFLLPQLGSEHATTMRVLESVPPAQEAYRPAPQCRSAFELARHIAFTEMWFLDGVLELQLGEDEVPPGGVTTCGHVCHWYRENFAKRIAALKALSSEHLATPVNFIGLRTYPAVVLLNNAIRHSVHHRGQLSAYLRPMGARVPAIYVESGDESFPEAREEAPPPARIPSTF